ncbi:uncharacterized protein LOC133917867 [Phragmites australis]|uniref:uncharacterized protein LOC133917867 n=1 Tax=Phragmites australis TaxID=29695 RepID=UPI002D7825CD|nr:uncharacterized protein LOC133917867 [Phragmites australis]
MPVAIPEVSPALPSPPPWSPVLIPVACAIVQPCHRHDMIHCDLKPENFLFANKKEKSLFKVIDFVLSIFFKSIESPQLRSFPDLGELSYRNAVIELSFGFDDLYILPHSVYIPLLGAPCILSTYSSTNSMPHPPDALRDDQNALEQNVEDMASMTISLSQLHSLDMNNRMHLDVSLGSLLCYAMERLGFTMIGQKVKRVHEGRYRAYVEFGGGGFAVYGNVMDLPFLARDSALVYALRYLEEIYGVDIIDVNYEDYII